jgi:hypothetical protein
MTISVSVHTGSTLREHVRNWLHFLESRWNSGQLCDTIALQRSGQHASSSCQPLGVLAGIAAALLPDLQEGLLPPMIAAHRLLSIHHLQAMLRSVSAAAAKHRG